MKGRETGVNNVADGKFGTLLVVVVGEVIPCWRFVWFQSQNRHSPEKKGLPPGFLYSSPELRV
jgi:hypothetical protein